MKRIKRYQNIFRGVRIPWVMLAVLLILNIIESHVFLEQTTLTADIIDASQKANLLIISANSYWTWIYGPTAVAKGYCHCTRISDAETMV